MKRIGNNLADEEMPEVSLKRAKVAGIGEYFRRMAAEQRYVQLDTDLAAEFPDAKSVNQALREYVKLRSVLQHWIRPGSKGRAKKSA